MKSVKELLREADPLQREPLYDARQRHFCRDYVLAGASAARGADETQPFGNKAFYATLGLVVIACLLFAMRSLIFIAPVQAAIQFEARIAENRAAPGLTEAKVSGTDRSVYLHPEIIVTNGEIASATVIQASSPSQYWVAIQFSASGAEKMRSATKSNIGKSLAILLDGQVTITPVLRSPIEGSARITGNFTKAQAQRIVNGIRIQ